MNDDKHFVPIIQLYMLIFHAGVYNSYEHLGRCKLGWFKSSKNPNPKSPYFTLEWKK
jgi:hypothetical protein